MVAAKRENVPPPIYLYLRPVPENQPSCHTASAETLPLSFCSPPLSRSLSLPPFLALSHLYLCLPSPTLSFSLSPYIYIYVYPLSRENVLSRRLASHTQPSCHTASAEALPLSFSPPSFSRSLSVPPFLALSHLYLCLPSPALSLFIYIYPSSRDVYIAALPRIPSRACKRALFMFSRIFTNI